MSASNEWTEYHLTPGGWVKGSEKVDFGDPTDVEPPPDRVLTQRYREVMSHGTSPIDKFRKEMWRGKDERLIADLLAKYGECPFHL